MAKKKVKKNEDTLPQAVIDRFTNDQFDDITSLPGFKWISEPPQPVKKGKKNAKRK